MRPFDFIDCAFTFQPSRAPASRGSLRWFVSVEIDGHKRFALVACDVFIDALPPHCPASDGSPCCLPAPPRCADDYVKLKGKKAGEVGYPVRWMAPESLQDASVWTIETDVWTWGVTAWEIASLGLRPHSDVADPAVAGHVIGGARLPTGRLDIADNVSTAITQAFEPVPELRPTVEQVVAEVEAALARLGGSGGRGANGSPWVPPFFDDLPSLQILCFISFLLLFLFLCSGCVPWSFRIEAGTIAHTWAARWGWCGSAGVSGCADPSSQSAGPRRPSM